jgi:hypothetical protein
MKIKVKGNRESFYLTRQISNLEISLNGDFNFAATNTIKMVYDNTIIPFENRHSVFQISEQLKGANTDRLILTLQDCDIQDDFLNKLKKKSKTEINLLKALFLIYNWIELPMTDPIEMNLEQRIYDDFIIDYTGKPESQEDVYFIDKKHITSANLPKIQRLIDLNLLVKATIEVGNNNYETYFIPLLKPGIPKKYFETEFDISGVETNNLWKSILFDRDLRIKNWINNRYS